MDGGCGARGTVGVVGDSMSAGSCFCGAERTGVVDYCAFGMLGVGNKC